MELMRAKELIDRGIQHHHMVLAIGLCEVDYTGRAASKLPLGKRLLLFKGDASFSIHQNKLLRPTNYLVGCNFFTQLNDGKLIVFAEKKSPKERITVYLEGVDLIHVEEMDEGIEADIRLIGSEKQLSDQLMQDLSFIEKGLIPLKQEDAVRKGKIDIIAEDKKGRIVVIEVKRRMADFDAVMQLERYVKDMRKIKNKETRGILIAPDIRPKAREMLEKANLEYAKFDFDVTAATAKIKGLEKKQQTLFEAFKK